MAQLTINYTATADLKSFSTWLTNNVDQSLSTWDSTTKEGVLVLNNNVTSIEGWTFYNCTDLLTIDIPEGITQLGGQNTFQNCSNLTTVHLPDSLLRFGNDSRDGIFSGCTSLTTINIPDNITQLNSSFDGCTSLTSIDLNNITQLNGQCFNNCTSLTNVIMNNIVRLGDGAGMTGAFGNFYNCSALSSVTLPDTITYIGSGNFNSCTNLTSVTCLATTPPTLGQYNFTASNDTLYVPPTSVSAYQSDSSWSSVFTTITTIQFKIHYTATADLMTSPTSWMTTNVASSTYDSITGQGTLTLNSGVTEIGNNAFSSKSALTSVEIGEGITTIGFGAFQSCSNLLSIYIPKTVNSIYSNNPFYNCTNLESIIVDSNNTVYDSRENCNAIIRTSNNSLCVGSKNTVIPNSVTSIANSAFSGIGITSIDLNNVTSLAEKAFTNSSLTSINLKNVTSTGFQAFRGCSSLTSAIISDKLTSINEQLFGSCYNLESIIVDSNNTVYDSRENCNAIIQKSNNRLIQGCKTSVIPTSVTSIGNWAFVSSGITNITIPSSVTSIGSNAFNGCSSLVSINIPSSVTSIADGTFNGCTHLTTITIPTSITSIGQQAFYQCYALKSVTCLRTTPPTLGNNNFDASGDTLYVPIASKSDYQSASNWSTRFTNYVGLCEVTLTVTGSGSVNPSSTTLNEGESVTLTITPAEGYGIFSVTDNGTSVPVTRTGMTYTISNIAADHTIAVVFKPLFTITTSAGTGGSITPSMTVMQNEDATIVITPNAGYSVSHVYVDGVDQGSILNYSFQNVVANHIVTAEFVLLYTVSTTTTEGGSISPESSTVEAGSDVTLTITPDEGMLIFNVIDNGTPVAEITPSGMTYTISNIQENHTIEATFDIAQKQGFNLKKMLDTNYMIQNTKIRF